LTPPSQSSPPSHTRLSFAYSDPHSRLFGVTTLDVVRASTFLSGIANTDPANVNVHVVGGHSGATIVPLLSQTKEGLALVKEGGKKYEDLVHRIQFGGDEVVKAKDGAGSATVRCRSSCLGLSSTP
jgi:malate dehydrogenase